MDCAVSVDNVWSKRGNIKSLQLVSKNWTDKGDKPSYFAGQLLRVTLIEYVALMFCFYHVVLTMLLCFCHLNSFFLKYYAFDDSRTSRTELRKNGLSK